MHAARLEPEPALPAIRPRIAVAQLGARRHYAVPRLLHEAGMLERLFTDSYAGNRPGVRAALAAIPERLRPGALERWLGRHEPALPPEKITSFELLGLRYVHGRRARSSPGLARLHAEVAGAFNARIARAGLGAADTVLAASGAALELLAWAKDRGLRCVLEQTDLPRSHKRRLLARERARFPGWEPGEEMAAADPLAERERAEWRLADRILVASPCTLEALVAAGVPADRCRIVPYGVDLSRFARSRPRAGHGRLRVLFAGQVGLRKGVPDLLQALAALGPRRVEARLAGSIALAPERLAPYGELARFLGPVPRARMPELFAWADLLVFPTLGEGFGLVQIEALAAGLPVIATPCCGRVVRDGIDGRIVPPAASEAIAAWLDHYAARPAELAALAEAALDGARAFSLEAYGARLCRALGEPG